MPKPRAPQRGTSTKPATTPAPHRWLILVHLLPATPSNLRVRTWRRLQQLGALAVKQSVYLLPDSPSAREDFEWLRTEITASGGEATVFAADNVDSWSDDALVAEFRRTSQGAYAELAGDVEKALGQLGRPRARTGRAGAAAARRGRPVGFRQRLAELERIDFFGGAGRERVAALILRFEARTAPSTGGRAHPEGARAAAAYTKRVWVTRPRPGVDRMASAWLIRRFIDPGARFAFAADAASAPPGAVPFDMFEVELGHHGERCTFETLCERFGLGDAAVRHLATIVHDLDLKDGKFDPADAPAIGQIIDGMQLACEADDALLAQGMALFEALYQSAARASRAVPAPPPRRPRPTRRLTR